MGKHDPWHYEQVSTRPKAEGRLGRVDLDLRQKGEDFGFRIANFEYKKNKRQALGNGKTTEKNLTAEKKFEDLTKEYP